MAEPKDHVLVRDLDQLTVMVDDCEIIVALVKSEDDTMKEYLNDVLSSLTRKVEAITARESHTVLGFKGLIDETLKTIFLKTYGVPYQKNLAWQGEWNGTTGAFVLVAPAVAASTEQRTKSCGSKRKKSTRTVPKVSWHLFVMAPRSRGLHDRMLLRSEQSLL